MTAYSVVSYSIDNLVQCLVDASKNATDLSVRAKRQCDYFEKYFNTLNAKTIVVESSYIDKDYLEDYAAYYDRCFHDYSRRTQRLHFFDCEFSDDEFQSILDATGTKITETDLQKSYLGFVVAKPLPQTIIGRTCLRTYPSDSGRRQFPSLRQYQVNLFGIDLSVESLAYQEQDTVVAACATSALWSCFQATGKLFQHQIPPPVEITNWAATHVPENLLAASSRAFPNSGLTLTQMAHAIRRVGLEPLVVGAPSAYGLNGVVYAYLRGKIPCILAGQLIDSLTSQNPSLMGGHAIAITGFSLDEKAAHRLTTTGFKLRASKVEKFYGHDDQVGPFARMGWNNFQSPIHVKPLHQPITEALDTSWSGNVHMKPDVILLPLYHKIRIPYSLVHDAILALDALIENLRSQVLSQIERVEWDIYLTTASEYKSSIRSDYKSLGIDVKNSLLVNLPKFVWRTTGRIGGKVEVDFLFDATGIAQHDLLVHAVSAGGVLAQMIAAVGMVTSSQAKPVNDQIRAIFNRFLISPIVAKN